ncbi:SHOCT domain-containing protein [Halosimplex sp. TS25]|uniref:SHOCT domain-containing protein n=1 Tax=Halosimplex rarum TaxID=3396619 RepID=UPI0039E9524B
MSDETDDPMEALIGIVAVATLPLTALAGIFLGEAAAATVAITGWLFLVPVLAILSDYVDIGEWWDSARSTEKSIRERDREHAETGDAALQRLRDRYAAGEIDDVEFERRLERLLETEDAEVPDHVDLNGTAEHDSRRGRGRERTPEREPE